MSTIVLTSTATEDFPPYRTTFSNAHKFFSPTPTETNTHPTATPLPSAIQLEGVIYEKQVSTIAGRLTSPSFDLLGLGRTIRQ